jgi:HSP20 family protein
MALITGSSPLWGDDIFSSILRPFAEGGAGGAGAGTALAMRPMPLDLQETEAAFICKADVPGLNKEDVSVIVDGNVLSIKAEKKEEKEEEGGTGETGRWHRKERSRSFVQRSIRMPESADLENIKAKLEGGTLSLQIPKKAEAETRRRIAVE